jgi:hypothetical protein
MYQGLCKVDSAKANRNKRMRSMESRIGWSRRVAKQQEEGAVVCCVCLFSLVFFDSPSTAGEPNGH